MEKLSCRVHTKTETSLWGQVRSPGAHCLSAGLDPVCTVFAQSNHVGAWQFGTAQNESLIKLYANSSGAPNYLKRCRCPLSAVVYADWCLVHAMAKHNQISLCLLLACYLPAARRQSRLMLPARIRFFCIAFFHLFEFVVLNIDFYFSMWGLNSFHKYFVS